MTRSDSTIISAKAAFSAVVPQTDHPLWPAVISVGASECVSHVRSWDKYDRAALVARGRAAYAGEMAREIVCKAVKTAGIEPGRITRADIDRAAEKITPAVNAALIAGCS